MVVSWVSNVWGVKLADQERACVCECNVDAILWSLKESCLNGHEPVVVVGVA